MTGARLGKEGHQAITTALDAKTLKEFVGLVKASPGNYNYGSPGPASPPHVSGALFSAVSESLATRGQQVPVRAVGVQDEFCSFGSNEYVARTHGLTADAVVAAVEDLLAARR